MEISLINAGLAAGAALAALPVILHLFMKQTPKRVDLPRPAADPRTAEAVAEEAARSRTGCLLLARMALVALMALALARPGCSRRPRSATRRCPRRSAWSSTPACRWVTRRRTGPGSTRPRSGPTKSSRRRPTRARSSSIDSAEPGVPTALSPASARKRIEGLALRAANRPLNAALGQAYAGGRRLRPAAPRGLRPDRPGPLGLGHGPPVEGLDKLEEGQDGGR